MRDLALALALIGRLCETRRLGQSDDVVDAVATAVFKKCEKVGDRECRMQAARIAMGLIEQYKWVFERDIHIYSGGGLFCPGNYVCVCL